MRWAPLLRNHVYEILGGQKFHLRTSYPKVLAFEPVYLLSDLPFSIIRDIIAQAIRR
jgi:hypothetical protein